MTTEAPSNNPGSSATFVQPASIEFKKEKPDSLTDSSNPVEEYNKFVVAAREALGLNTGKNEALEQIDLSRTGAVLLDPQNLPDVTANKVNQLGTGTLLEKKEQPINFSNEDVQDIESESKLGQKRDQDVAEVPAPDPLLPEEVSAESQPFENQIVRDEGQVPVPIPVVPGRDVIPPRVEASFQTKVQEIKDKIAADNHENNSTQSILRDALGLIHVNGVEASKISSNLNRNADGKYVFETFTTQTNPPYTCYKIKSTYSIVVKNNADQEETITFDRYIYTNEKISESTERALFAVSKYKDFMIELAQAPIDNREYNGRLQNYPLTEEARVGIAGQRLFGVNFIYKKNSKKIKSVASLNLSYSDDKTLKEMSLSLPYKTLQDSSYVGNLSRKSPMGKKSNKENIGADEFFYKSKEEALRNSSCIVSDSEFLTNLELAGETTNKIQKIYEDIKKSQKKFDKLRAEFIQEKTFISSEKETDKFKEMKSVFQYFNSSQSERLEMENKTFSMMKLEEVNQELKNFHVSRDELEKQLVEVQTFLEPGYVLSDENKNQIIFLKNIVIGSDININIAGEEKTVTEQDVRDVIDGVSKKISQIDLKKNLELQIHRQYNDFKQTVANIHNLNEKLNNDLKQLKDIRKMIKAQLKVVKNAADRQRLEKLKDLVTGNLKNLIQSRKIKGINKKTDRNIEFVNKFDVLVKGTT